MKPFRCLSRIQVSCVRFKILFQSKRINICTTTLISCVFAYVIEKYRKIKSFRNSHNAFGIDGKYSTSIGLRWIHVFTLIYLCSRILLTTSIPNCNYNGKCDLNFDFSWIYWVAMIHCRLDSWERSKSFRVKSDRNHLEWRATETIWSKVRPKPFGVKSKWDGLQF